jgi:hypothetical protein
MAVNQRVSLQTLRRQAAGLQDNSQLPWLM